MAPIPPSASRFGALIDTVQSSACSPHGQELLPGTGLGDEDVSLTLLVLSLLSLPGGAFTVSLVTTSLGNLSIPVPLLSTVRHWELLRLTLALWHGIPLPKGHP